MNDIRNWLLRVWGPVVFTLAWQSAEADSQQLPKEPPITAEQRQHWAYRPLQRPDIPAVKNARWPRNAIDRFILSRMERADLQPAPEADRATLIRRVTFDLTGLPPTPQEIDRFLRDDSPDAYERLVERLLASPAYGEHQAQWWLDLARFAETDGFEHDKIRPQAWRYRDWVIAAFSADMPYDEFVRLQLAADQLPSPNTADQSALGFLLCGPDMPDINLQNERRHNFLNELTATAGSVFLGLQFGCAQCHDHKYDPISQYDFYRLRAFFDPYVQFERNQPARWTGPAGNPVVSRLMIRGDFRRPGPVVRPAFPRIAASHGSGAVPVDGARRRAQLANWLTGSDHPLTTRVIVNRLWQAHFGRGLSASASDFGLMGDEPLHKELLDWLAGELPRRRWSLKAMHRLMVTSATYRQASRQPEDGAASARAWTVARQRDAANALWTRMPRRRLTGEAIRDAMLSASGSLSQRRGGAGVRPPLPREVTLTLLKNQWPVSPDERDHRRRSIYLFVRRNLQFPVFSAFDKPDTNASCPRRNRSTTAPQSLLLLNSKFSFDAAHRLSQWVRREAGTDPGAQVSLAFRRTLGRRPTAREKQWSAQFLALDKQRLREEQPAVPPQTLDSAALRDFCLLLFNLNEFVYID